jgi:hypothetical protein
MRSSRLPAVKTHADFDFSFQPSIKRCADASRARRSHQNATPQVVVDQVLALRRKYPEAGPRTLLWHLEQRDPRGAWPSPITIGEILKRHDLIKPRGRRRPRTTWNPARTIRMACGSAVVGGVLWAHPAGPLRRGDSQFLAGMGC